MKYKNELVALLPCKESSPHNNIHTVYTTTFVRRMLYCSY